MKNNKEIKTELLLSISNKTKVTYIPNKFHEHVSINKGMILKVLTCHKDEIEEALRDRTDCVICHEFEENIGVSHCIKCEPYERHVYYKQRENRPYLSRMVKGALPVACKEMTIVLKPSRVRTDEMVLVTSWVGGLSEPEPDNEAYFKMCPNPKLSMQKSIDYWENHALIEERPTAQELFEDLEIISSRMGYDLETLTDSQLKTLVAARLANDEFLTSEDICMSKTKENVIIYLNSLLNGSHTKSD